MGARPTNLLTLQRIGDALNHVRMLSRSSREVARDAADQRSDSHGQRTVRPSGPIDEQHGVQQLLTQRLIPMPPLLLGVGDAILFVLLRVVLATCSERDESEQAAENGKAASVHSPHLSSGSARSLPSHLRGRTPP
jgi:hypothetical protein